MVLSKNTFCWKNSLATHIFLTQQKSIMLYDVDVSCICTHGRCHVMLTTLALAHMARAARCGSISGKTPPPEIGAQFGPRVGGVEPATFRLQASEPPTRPNSGGQHGHTSSFAT